MIKRIIGFFLDLLIGMIVCAYLLSHTAIGFSIYSKIANIPDIKTEDVVNFTAKTAKNINDAYNIANDIYKKFKK